MYILKIGFFLHPKADRHCLFWAAGKGWGKEETCLPFTRVKKETAYTG